MDWRETVNLPHTELPMRANLPQREPEIEDRWKAMDLYGRLRAERAGAPRFVLHDGPPYANGEIHMGTTLNKVLKDIVVRYQSMRGRDAPFVPGWDTHGLPIELRAIREHDLDRARVAPLELRAYCRDFARHFIGVMTAQFERLGVLADWQHPYVTLDPSFEAREVELFGAMMARGCIYKGLKAVYWCWDCMTALAESEIEFQEVASPSIHVAFDVADGKGVLPAGARVVIWTTTPWTLPANVAVALHGQAVYELVDTARGALLLARERREAVLGELGLESRGLLGSWTGAELEGVACRHPFLDRTVPLVLADYVVLTEGTGAVHTAPGHGREDFETGRRYGLPVLVPVDARGRLTADAGPFAGLSVAEADPAIVAALEHSGHLLRGARLTHAYAHCWRCKNPVIWRATEQWFVDVGAFRAQALEALSAVRWIPAWGEERIRRMVADRGDWCLSRQRVWGVPIPVLYCAACDRPLTDPALTARIAALFGREGSDAWYRLSAEEIAGPGVACPACGATALRKESDILDVWFDSGASHAAVLQPRDDLAWPADLYLEGSDQHRGWFQTSLLTSVASTGQAPYHAVLTHGFVLDGQGRPMHKSLGNVVAPDELMARYGADVVRLWAASADYAGDVRLSGEIMEHTADAYRKLRNTLRFCLGNLDDFVPERDAVELGAMGALDRWALHRAAEVAARVTRAYEACEYHLAVQALHHFCVVDLSAFYLDVAKDRLYCSGPHWRQRRAAQTVLEHLARMVVRLLAPLMPHTADEVWEHLPRRAGDPESVHLALWPDVPPAWRDDQLGARWARFLDLRGAVARALEQARAAKAIRAPLDAAVTLYAADEVRRDLEPFAADLAELLITSEAALVAGGDPAAGSGAADVQTVAPGLAVAVVPATTPRCPRCWRHQADVGCDAGHPELCGRCARAVADRPAGAAGEGPKGAAAGGRTAAAAGDRPAGAAVGQGSGRTPAEPGPKGPAAGQAAEGEGAGDRPTDAAAARATRRGAGSGKGV